MMKPRRSNLWRLFFVLGGAGILAGGPLHPDGTMAEMLAHPDWFRAHARMVAGFVAMVIGLTLFGHRKIFPARTALWLRLALVGVVLQAIEMVIHTAAMVDHDRLVAGEPTPMLTTHLWAAALFYPIFAVTVSGFIVAAARDRVLGSWWIAWLGIAGAVAHGVAAPLAVIWDIQAGLFGMITLLALWFLIAACWPTRLVAADGA